MDPNLVNAAPSGPQPANPTPPGPTSGPTPSGQPAAPAGVEVPEKFRDPATGEVRVDLLVQSYRALERKLARMVEVPDDDADAPTRAAFRRRMGVPDRPEDYPITPPSDLIQPDPEVNRILNDADMTPRQVQLVYDLAAQRMLPAIDGMAREFEADRQMERLVEHFGSAEKFREVADALRAWGKKNLPPEVFKALSTTFEGIQAMHKMMASEEPGLSQQGTFGSRADETDLRRMMADPKYWRDRDPATIRKVTEGFKKLFPGETG